MDGRTPIDGRSPADRPPTATSSPTDRSAITNNAAKARWDAKTPQGRRCRDLFRSVMRLIGNPPEPARQAQAISAAELMVVAEVARETALKDPTPKALEMAFKSEKAMRHALSALDIEKPSTEDAAESVLGLFVDDVADDGDVS